MLRTTGHGCLWLFLLIITIQVLPVPRSAAGAALSGPRPVELGETWQSSQEAVVQLGVRNKFGNRAKYTATWIVMSGVDGTRYEAKATVERNNWGFVYYPGDFHTYAKPGGYTWACLVDGKRVAAGSFEFKSVQGYSDQLEVP